MLAGVITIINWRYVSKTDPLLALLDKLINICQWKYKFVDRGINVGPLVQYISRVVYYVYR